MKKYQRPEPPEPGNTDSLEQPLEQLVSSSGLIFSGTVVQRGTSTVLTLSVGYIDNQICSYEVSETN